MKPANTTQDGPARIAGISADPNNRNVTVGQGLWGTLASNLYNVRLRTSSTGLNGSSPDLRAPAGSATTALQHVVYTRDSGGTARIYVDGVQVEDDPINGDLSNWDADYKLVLGNEATGDRPWAGDLYKAAFYDCDLTAEDVELLYEESTNSNSCHPGMSMEAEDGTLNDAFTIWTDAAASGGHSPRRREGGGPTTRRSHPSAPAR